MPSTKSTDAVRRLAVGTAQFGLTYGIANRAGKVSPAEVTQILEYAARWGITRLDTASGYGEAEQVLGGMSEQLLAEFDIVSKVPVLEAWYPGVLRESISDSLARLNVSMLDGYLVHNYENFKQFSSAWPELKGLAREGLTGAVGFSLYETQHLDEILQQDFDIGMVQVPYSVFDRRFEKYFPVLKERGVEVSVRSVFLQGLAMMDPGDVPRSLKPAIPVLHLLRELAAKCDMTVPAVCLNYVVSQPLIDRVVIGVDGISQFQANVKSVRDGLEGTDQLIEWSDLVISQEEILLPFRWGDV